MKLMTLKQYMKMSKKALIRKITKSLRAMPKKKLAAACYNLTKAKLPQLKTKNGQPYEILRKTHQEYWDAFDLDTIKQKALPKHKTKTKKKKIVGEIYYTKNDQPYEILPTGKARFVKK